MLSGVLSSTLPHPEAWGSYLHLLLSNAALFVQSCAHTSISQLAGHLLFLVTGSSDIWRAGKGSILSAALSPSLGLQPLTSAGQRQISVVSIRDGEFSSPCQEESREIVSS